MSRKRPGTTDINRENWDHDDSSEKEQIGTFGIASQEALEKRAFRTAKRRIQPSADGSKKGVFSGFAGFNKPAVTSFDCLANLTNGSNTNGVTKSDTAVTSSLFSSSKPITPSGGLFSAFPSSSTFASNAQNTLSFASTVGKTEVSPMIFSSSTADSTVGDSPMKMHPVSSSVDSNTKPSSTQATSTIFGVSSTSTNQKPLGTSTEFKQPVSSTSTQGQNSAPIASTQGQNSAPIASPQGQNSAPIASTQGQNSAPIATEISQPESTAFYDTEIQKAKNKYYSRLKGLNQSVSKWIVKHVEETPFCFLTPIFKDYENYLKEMQEEFIVAKSEAREQMNKMNSEVKPAFATKNSETSLFSNKSGQDAKPSPQSFGINATSGNTNTTGNTGLFGQKSAANTSQSPNQMSSPPNKRFSLGITSTPLTSNTTSPSTNEGTGASTTQGHTFGIKPSPASETSMTPPSKGFSLGITPGINQSPAPEAAVSPLSKGFSFGSTPASNTGSAFALNNTGNAGSPPNKGFSFGMTATATSPGNTSLFTAPGAATGSSPIQGVSPFGMSSPAAPTNASGAAPFSFGIGSGKPFSFSSQIQQQRTTETINNEDEEDQPPKVEFTPVVEENSVYDKKCKIFVKKAASYVDIGIGTLYVKKVAESGKYQLLVRANTNLGTVLLNLILGESVPIQRMGKNNVMLVCIPTPDAKPPPTPVLIRVKTGEEADALLETLNKYKS